MVAEFFICVSAAKIGSPLARAGSAASVSAVVATAVAVNARRSVGFIWICTSVEGVWWVRGPRAAAHGKRPVACSCLLRQHGRYETEVNTLGSHRVLEMNSG